ncbi:hypothetical protein AA309_14520 [Microvirga vignae]|uniref:Uncharacterized protein n=1 Tax=Microvirga vignae TaxID=1225564 RepID=A0A0H1RB32_9HYPH|nr:hypothetical protein [Microvirga vignae]KLK92425.1 hypothetical protein AA309_14520 [Microvirga vignae]
MTSVFGFFFGRLDGRRRFTKIVNVPTGITSVTARKFRVKLVSPPPRNPDEDTLYAEVTATVRGAERAIERVIYSEYQDYHDLRQVPQLPESFCEGNVRRERVDLYACLPEYEVCNEDCEAEPLNISPPVSSVGFLVEIHLNIQALPAGTNIKGVIALSDG